ncbi:uncharacterized protein AMSG_09774 [Thecamonas trahens ATCC 50062]|uniref:Uncharacterized protein n=1 Tax=Thecamonas trahens ATCC 50062 TaxID=461836 RepID=A0A0L0DNJ0_THETB|nr:hypothetical protein AMSG_09774 [Thecamonas trahens ATCC 50062]KNC53830.1 hypothetical protein AMSG_09774 [Thecamonas trahens ATCC 50062]|eukprot:XP_013754214.1 hypothetical protein AMSG_09774 [Thecamonas trahens ATCC 50062]
MSTEPRGHPRLSNVNARGRRSSLGGSLLAIRAGNFWEETPLPEGLEFEDQPTVENTAWEKHWYRRYFVQADHDVFVGKHDKIGGVVMLSIVRDDISGVGAQFRTIVWRSSGATLYVIPVTEKEAKQLAGGKEWKLKDTLARLHGCELSSLYKKFRTVTNPEVMSDLLRLEAMNPGHNRFHQIGVMYGGQGQSAEMALLANNSGSAAYNEFLELLGTEVGLAGYTGFAGGLDVTTEAKTGATSRRTSFRGHEIMYLIATNMPDADTRARVLGSAIVRIVFLDGDNTFTLESMAKASTVVVAVVQTVPDDDSMYSLTLAYESGTALVGPPLKARYPKNGGFIQTLLAKLINVERAVVTNEHSRLSVLQQAEHAMGRALETAYKKYYNKKASDYNLHGSLAPSADLPADALAAIGGGFEPDSASVLRTQVILEAFPQPITCLAPWDDDSLFYGASEGLFLLDKVSSNNIKLKLGSGASHMLQLDVLKEEGVVLALSGATPSVSVMDVDRIVTKKPKIKVLSQTSKAHLFTTGLVGTATHLCVAVHSDVIVFKWDDFDRTFVELSKIRFPAKPLTMVMSNDGSGSLCVAFKSQFVLVNLKTEAITQLHEDSSSSPMAAFLLDNVYFTGIDAPSMGAMNAMIGSACNRWLLCYQKCAVLMRVLVAPDGETSVTHEYSAHWQVPPQAITLLPPYVLSVSSSVLEVRNVVNGTLLQTFPIHILPDTTFSSVLKYAGRALYVPSCVSDDHWRINRLTPTPIDHNVLPSADAAASASSS